MRTTFTKDGVPIACGEIDSLQGCTQLAVFHSSFVLPQYRKSGEGLKAHYERLHTAKENLFDAAICTVDKKNEVQIKILERFEWKQVHEFTSSKTGNIVTIWVRNL